MLPNFRCSLDVLPLESEFLVSSEAHGHAEAAKVGHGLPAMLCRGRTFPAVTDHGTPWSAMKAMAAMASSDTGLG